MNNYLETITLQPLLGCLIELSSCLYTRQGIVVLSTESGDILLTLLRRLCDPSF